MEEKPNEMRLLAELLLTALPGLVVMNTLGWFGMPPSKRSKDSFRYEAAGAAIVGVLGVYCYEYMRQG